MSAPLVLGLETSCDETSAAVLRGEELLGHVVLSQDVHEVYGGVVPELAARAHLQKVDPVVDEALARAGAGIDEVEAVAVTAGPGLIGALLVGVSWAKAAAFALGRPLVAVHHMEAHLFGPLLDDPEARPPFVALLVSGGHTLLLHSEAWGRYCLLGQTRDDAAGEAFDKAAAILGLPFPGGPSVDRAAREPGADDRAVELPVSRLGRESLDFSFSGLKTALLYEVRGKPRPRAEGGGFERDHASLTPGRRRDLAATFERAVVEAIVLKLGRAFETLAGGGTVPASLLCGGGVTANTRLRAALEAFAAERRLDLRLPRLDLCVDNAAMIAGLGARLLAAGRAADLSLTATPTTGC